MGAKSLCIFLAILFLAGCVTTRTTYTSLIPQTYPTNQNKPEVLFQAPNRPFEIIGLLESNPSVMVVRCV